jgi:hypothetical protein
MLRKIGSPSHEIDAHRAALRFHEKAAAAPRVPTNVDRPPERNSAKMKLVRALAIAVLLSLLAGCAHPPQAAIDAARTALEAASRSPDIVIYAPDALRRAQDKMNALEAEIDRQAHRSALSRNYDACAALAQETTDLAAGAGTAAESAKKQVASDASGLVDEVSAAIPGFESKMWAARRVPRIKMDLIAALASVPDQARAAVDDARKDIASGAFAAAKARLMAAKDQLSSSEETITEQVRIARAR